MPVDVTENFVHVRLKDPSAYDTCRLSDFKGSLPSGVRAKYCRRKDDGSWEVQAYIFDKSTWTKDHAVSWAEKHAAASLSEQVQIQYQVTAAAVEIDGKKYAAIDIIDQST